MYRCCPSARSGSPAAERRVIRSARSDTVIRVLRVAPEATSRSRGCSARSFRRLAGQELGDAALGSADDGAIAPHDYGALQERLPPLEKIDDLGRIGHAVVGDQT